MQNQAQNEQNQNNLLSTNKHNQVDCLGGLMSDPTARLLIGANHNWSWCKRHRSF